MNQNRRGWTPELKKLVTPGNAVRVNFGEGNPNNKIEHIRAIVDGDVVVAREWIRSKGYWRYSCKEVYWYSMLLEGGELTAQ